MSQTHAPGEWRKVLEHIPYSESFRIVDEGTIVAHGVNLKNAERIVLCCNAHDDLVELAKQSVEFCDQILRDFPHLRRGVEAHRSKLVDALAKAGEK